MGLPANEVEQLECGRDTALTSIHVYSGGEKGEGGRKAERERGGEREREGGRTVKLSCKVVPIPLYMAAAEVRVDLLMYNGKMWGENPCGWGQRPLCNY